MKLFLRLLACAAAGCALFTAASAVLAWAGGPGPGSPSGLLELPGLLWDIQENRRLERELDRRARQVARRLAEKDAVAADLVEGRLSLREAAARFRILNEEDPAAVEANRATYPSSSDEEAALRQVLAWALSRFEEYPPGRSAEARGRLEREARAALPGP